VHYRRIIVLYITVMASVLHANSNFFKNDLIFLDADFTYVTLERMIENSSDSVHADVNDIVNVTATATLLPKSYNIQLSLGKNLTDNVDDGLYNPQGYDSNAYHAYFSIAPYYHPKYGGFGLFYTFAQQNSIYSNVSNSPIALSQYAVDETSIDNWNLLPFAGALQPNESLQFKEEVSYVGVKYYLPAYSFLPQGTNIFYSQMDRSTLYYGTLGGRDQLILVAGKGQMYGFGLQRELYELPNNRLSVDLVQISKGGFADFPKLELYEASGGVTYKMSNFFMKAFALIYVADEYNAQLNGEALHIPRVTDLLLTMHAGVSF